MKLKIGYLYKDINDNIYQMLDKYDVFKSLRYKSININDTTSSYYYFDLRGKYFSSPSDMDLIEEIGKAEDNPEYFL